MSLSPFFKDSGMQVEDTGQGIFSPIAPVGIELQVGNRENPPKHASALITALLASKVGVRPTHNPSLDANTVFIIVGTKPKSE